MTSPHRPSRSDQARASKRMLARRNGAHRRGEIPATLPDEAEAVAVPAEPEAKRDERSMASRKERRQRKRDDIRNASKKQRQVMEIWNDLDVMKGIRSLAGRDWKPNLIDQVHAAERRVWRQGHVRRLRREFRCPRGRYRQNYAVTLARPEWIFPSLDHKVTGDILGKIRRQVQRQAKRLPQPSLVTGQIDLCYLTDDYSGVHGWAFHVHLTVTLALVARDE